MPSTPETILAELTEVRKERLTHARGSDAYEVLSLRIDDLLEQFTEASRT